MTTYLTIDAGLAFKMITPHSQQQHYIDLVTHWKKSNYQLCAPTLWAYEITSTFTKMIHFGHLEYATGLEGLKLAYQLGVQLIFPDKEQALKAFSWTNRLQRAAAYDSFYLALAEALDCEFWTVDKRLVNAVGEPWVNLA